MGIYVTLNKNTKWSAIYIELTSVVKCMSTYEWRNIYNPILTRLQYLIINVLDGAAQLELHEYRRDKNGKDRNNK